MLLDLRSTTVVPGTTLQNTFPEDGKGTNSGHREKCNVATQTLEALLPHSEVTQPSTTEQSVVMASATSQTLRYFMYRNAFFASTM